MKKQKLRKIRFMNKKKKIFGNQKLRFGRDLFLENELYSKFHFTTASEDFWNALKSMFQIQNGQIPIKSHYQNLILSKFLRSLTIDQINNHHLYLQFLLKQINRWICHLLKKNQKRKLKENLHQQNQVSQSLLLKSLKDLSILLKLQDGF